MKIIKAEMWDKTQYLFRNYYDRMVHAVLYYDAMLDIKILKEVVLSLTEKTPVLHSKYHNNPIKPYWSVESYTIDDILTVKESTDIDNDINSFITGEIPANNNVQYKIAVFNKNNRSALLMLVNHMCFDGGDFKYFLATLAENYNKVASGIKSVAIKQGSRAHTEVYTGFKEDERKKAESLYKNISKVKEKRVFPLTSPSAADKKRIIMRKIGEDLFIKLKEKGKIHGATVNDVLLAVYVRALYDIGGYDPKSPLTVPCMMDLRRYIKNGGKSSGLANHTGFMPCTVEEKGDTVIDTLIMVLRSAKKSKRDRYMGLYSLPLLKLAYAVFPHFLSEFAIKLGYSNPLIGMSNIGILDADKLSMGNAKLIDGFLTGAVKYKPYMQLALTTLNNVITLTVAIRGNDEDEATVNKFFDLLIENIKEYVA